MEVFRVSSLMEVQLSLIRLWTSTTTLTKCARTAYQPSTTTFYSNPLLVLARTKDSLELTLLGQLDQLYILLLCLLMVFTDLPLQDLQYLLLLELLRSIMDVTRHLPMTLLPLLDLLDLLDRLDLLDLLDLLDMLGLLDTGPEIGPSHPGYPEQQLF
jgi:hypothetical protein